MPLRRSEAFILRTYSFKESDRIVVFFTRDFGKLRGVARGARRPKSKFGATLEPLTQVRVEFFEREGRDLCAVDDCELLASPLATSAADLLHAVAVSLIAEVADRMLPEAEVSPVAFRLLVAVTAALRQSPSGDGPWLALTYYLYWMVRIGGFLPPLELTPAATQLASSLATRALASLDAALDPDTAAAAASAPGRQLRQRLKTCLEEHLESHLRAWPMLATLET
ncbi:MAG: DNA repair protein RecO [Terriglobales bacterium]